jgi:uncharacterized protein (TIGR03000 family)
MRALLLSALVSASAPVLFAASPPAPFSGERETATIRVTLPADAKLTVDGHPTRSTSSERLLVSPPLDPGRDYRYTLKAEFVRGEKTITVQQAVLVRAGRETTVSLDVPSEASARYGAGNPAYAYGRGSPETSAFYYAPESSEPAPPAPRYFQPEATSRQAPSRPRFPFWGTDPSDPFYHSGQ